VNLFQLLCAGPVLARLARGRRRRPPLVAPPPGAPGAARVSVVIPARDEAGRIGPCLAGLRDDPDVLEVIVVDDRSADATAAVARAAGATVLEGAELPEGLVGKPWALQQGLQAAGGEVVVTLDADTRPRPGLVGALAAELLGRPERTLLTGAPRYVCDGPGERLLHPAFLATIVYRSGPVDVDGPQPVPGRVIANGQCLAARRETLLAAGGFALAGAHMTDDVALARALARRGWEVRGVDVADLLEVRMYESVAETWEGWGRSLMGPDVNPPVRTAVDLLTLWLVQALPLARILTRRAAPQDWPLAAVRLALTAATARSYARRGLPYWLSPLADVPALVRLTGSVLRPTRSWRGRSYGPAQKPF
jgi:dolichol-phosphate mannosyltransferase